jgi:hypothetical protein
MPVKYTNQAGSGRLICAAMTSMGVSSFMRPAKRKSRASRTCRLKTGRGADNLAAGRDVPVGLLDAESGFHGVLLCVGEC